ncbi:MAG: hypothetical protein ABW133_08065 [Polyangiaceae bacterium]
MTTLSRATSSRHARHGATALIVAAIALQASFASAEELPSWPPARGIDRDRPETTKSAYPVMRDPFPSVSSVEVWGAVGPSVTFGEPANPEYSRSFRRVGYVGEIGVAYRSSYFVDPFLLVTYADLAQGEASLPSGKWGEGGTLEQHLGAIVIAPGITTDLWRIRLRYGLGVAVVMQSFRFAGEGTSSTQLPLANQFGLGFNVFQAEHLRLDAEAKLVVATGADVSFATLSVVARGDLIRFGGE